MPFLDEIELLVSDNASTDATEQLLNQYIQDSPLDVRYRRISKNILGEQNFYQAMQAGTGQYCWLIGDDDEITGAAVALVLEAIKNHQPQMIICNFSLLSKDFSRVILEKYYAQPKSTLVLDHNQLLQHFGTQLSLISAVVFQKDAFFTISKERYDFFEPYGATFLASVYYAAHNACRAYYIDQPIVLNRTNNMRIEPSWNWERIFIEGFARVLNELQLLGYSRNAVYAAKNSIILKYAVNFIVNAKADRRPYANIYQSLNVWLRDTWTYRLICLPLRLVPDILLVLLKKMIRRLIGVQK